MIGTVECRCHHQHINRRQYLEDDHREIVDLI